MRPFSIEPTERVVENLFDSQTESSLEVIVLKCDDDGMDGVDEFRNPLSECVIGMAGRRRLGTSDIGSHIGVDLDIHARPKSD